MDYKKIQKYRERINRNRQKKSEEKDGRRKKAAYLFDSSKRLFLFNIGCTRLTGLGLNDWRCACLPHRTSLFQSPSSGLQSCGSVALHVISAHRAPLHWHSENRLILFGQLCTSPTFLRNWHSWLMLLEFASKIRAMSIFDKYGHSRRRSVLE